MLQLNARFFLGAVTQLRDMQHTVALVKEQKNTLAEDDVRILISHVELLLSAISGIGARSALRSAQRLDAKLKASPVTITYEEVLLSLNDIESRFADHLDDILLFVVPDQQAVLFKDAASLMESADIVAYFPSATFELEEAAKCLGLGRPTACVFHCMRMLEIGIGALAKHLEIEDPASATDRSWGVILGKIKDALDTQYPKKKRLPQTDGAELEKVYVTLDAIKGPWRNATMHVETVYTDADAQHILHCSAMFMRRLMERCDEQGQAPSAAV